MRTILNLAAAPAAPPLSAALLHLLAAALQGASAMLTRLAARLSVVQDVAPPARVVEFHAVYRDAGAPEGALYVNGELVGYLPGVTRL